jgi:SAM-dependent methyltransferase
MSGGPSGGASSPQHWFEPIADRLGASYLRYSHTKGTRAEVDHLVGALGLTAGQRVLDVGCGPGRHSLELARRGLDAHGVDISQRFVELATDAAAREGLGGATFERLDARSLPFDGEFDAAICLCQGAFGMMRAEGDDEAVLRGIARALRPGGGLALSAFNAYFSVKYHADASFDADAGVSHELTEVRDEAGAASTVDLWTGCYTPRELRLLAAVAGFGVERVSGVEPGNYADRPPTTELAEFLVIARRNR